MYELKRIWRVALDIFFPPVCVNCGKYAGDESLNLIICRLCFDSINIYSICLPSKSGSCEITIASAGRYSDKPLRELIHLLKYNGIESSATVLANIIGEYAERIGLKNMIDMNNAAIIPIPLHSERLRKRGFNQSELIANEVGKKLGIKVVNALKRVKNTSPQIEMKSDEEREKNIKGAFEVDTLNEQGIRMKGIHSPFPKGSTPAFAGGRDFYVDKSLILLDDVLTSGATIKEAIKVLKNLKPKKIIVLVVAQAGH